MAQGRLQIRQILSYQHFCLDVAQGRMIEASNVTQIHSWRFSYLIIEPLHYSKLQQMHLVTLFL